MNPQAVCNGLMAAGINAVCVPVTDSTQDEAVRLARQGVSSGTVVLAASQTNGRGRMGRPWLSPAGGLYASVILRPVLPGAEWPALTLHAGLSVVNTIRASGLRRAVLKWPNDCLVDGRKLCGLLAESLPLEGLVVFGIGMNVKADHSLTPEGGLQSRLPAVALEEVLRVDYDRVCVRLLGNMVISILAADRGMALDTAGIGEVLWTGGETSVCVDGRDMKGRVAGVDRSGRLILLTPDGGRLLVSSGEVLNACGS